MQKTDLFAPRQTECMELGSGKSIAIELKEGKAVPLVGDNTNKGELGCCVVYSREAISRRKKCVGDKAVPGLYKETKIRKTCFRAIFPKTGRKL